ncbi:AIPR family protein [Undibacterium crateris]|uniref:AIPR family protein n=1 Tax=Undibacterium crateris TaxID=2528175 RepID=UPI00138A5A21|nr:AIPR family protein [Undibacterium crateris]NDI86800.1 hypothetical protein [Undibacterium crateris]
MKNHVVNSVKEHLYLDDAKGDESKCMSRGLVAIALAGLSGEKYPGLSKYVTDGSKDNGIDGVFYDPSRNKLYIVQAKWSTKGTGTIDTGDLRKFIAGVYDLLNEEWTKFNKRFKAIASEISSGIKRDPEIVLVVAFNSDNEISEECQEIIDKFLSENNSDSQDIVTFFKFDLKKIIRTIKTAQSGSTSDVEVNLLQWGEQSDPYYSVYGKVSCADIAEWYSQHGDLLFTENIRNTLSDSDINSQIEATLLRYPKDFWYLNNGITAIADGIKRKPTGLGDQKESSNWKVSNIKIVNGAQTTGSIYAANLKRPDITKQGYVQVKIVSLENSPLDLSSKITTATNTQNRVEAKDFLALEELQNGLAESFRKMNIQYCYRRGEKVRDESIGLDVQELALTLALSGDSIANVVLAKRNAGSLTDRNGHYHKLFAAGIEAQTIWPMVQKLRKTTKALNEFANSQTAREAQLAIHGNRFIEHIALTTYRKTPTIDIIRVIHEQLLKIVNERFPESYLAVLFKNAKKCGELKEQLSATQKK